MSTVHNEMAPLLGGSRKSRLSVCVDEESLTPTPGQYRSIGPNNHAVSPVCREPRAQGSAHAVMDGNWGATPSMRKMWGELKRFDVSSDLERESMELPCSELRTSGPSSISLENLVGLIIALMLNLFLSMSFGQAFFPADWDFATSHVPREIGVQMFLFSTMLCQLVMTYASEFPCAMGMMMVENIPFMHTIAVHVQHRHGCGAVGTATVLAAFAVSSVVVGAFFFILGTYKLGNAVYFFPKHVILGCIGGVGVFVVKTGLEVSTNLTLTWDHAGFTAFTSVDVVPLWLVSCAYDIGLRILIARYHISILPPFYFVLIPPTFYFFVWMCGASIETAHANHWFFESSGHDKQDPFLMWELLKPDLVHWGTIAEMAPTIIALTIFSLMHVPINIPSLSVSTKVAVDMNKELRAHGMSNILVGLLGGCQNYTCYSNSFLYFKCGGGGIISGYLLAGFTAVFFLYGPEVIRFVPRCMAGCLLIHVGIDLFQEGLVDSFRNSDAFEFASLVTITAVMTLYGMTAGLGAGVVLAALTFTLQTSRHVSPIRGVMRATTLRSSAWRSPTVSRLLADSSTHISVMQLHGHLFFGNATLLKEEIDRILEEDRIYNRNKSTQKIWVLLLDFTLVLGIDSSAVDTIINIPKMCANYGIKVCFSRGSHKGFPCEMPLSDLLVDSQYACERRRRCCSSNFEESRIGVAVVDSDAMLEVADSLEQGLRWCENQVVVAARPELNPIDPYLNREHVREFPQYLHEIYLMHDNSVEITKLLSHFSVHVAKENFVLWKQGDDSSFALLLVEGALLSILENEAGTVETLQVGSLVGEYGLINASLRLSTVRAASNIKYLLLSSSAYDKMKSEDPLSVCLFSKLCIGYLGMRVQHVGNRIWESSCLPA